MEKITNIKAREILDSRGNPTIEVDITISNQHFGRASVPSGASTGSKEAIELRDNNQKRFVGKGVSKAVDNVNSIISKEIIGQELSQSALDNLLINLDGTKNKSNLGANAILATSLAFAKASAKTQNIDLFQHIAWGKISLPTPLVNILNGGAHADNNIAIQEFMIIPNGIELFQDKIRASTEIFHNLKAILKSKGLNTNVGDEGGFAPQINETKHAIELIMEAIEKSGYTLSQIKLGLDSAANEFYKDKMYHIDGKTFSSEKLIEYYEYITNHYPIISLEDPLSEYDLEGWKAITASLGNKIQIVGDDVFVTNNEILSQGIKDGIANSILIKPNQIGTLTETINTIKTAAENSYNSIISHRSGETEDTFIAHLAVASGCGQIKTGSMSRTDRTSKYNELLRISELL